MTIDRGALSQAPVSRLLVREAAVHEQEQWHVDMQHGQEASLRNAVSKYN